MQTYVIALNDKRYSQPQLVFATVASESRAIELAERQLGRSENYTSVEVRQGDTAFYRLRRDGEREVRPNPTEA